MITIWLSVFLLLFPGAKEEHAIYVSVTKIEILEDTTLVRIRVFSDDLQNGIRNYISERPNLKGVELLDVYVIEEYFNTYFVIDCAGDKRRLIIDSFEEVGDSHWISFTTKALKGRARLKANFLMEILPSQQNIVEVQRSASNAFHRLTVSDPSCVLQN